MNKSITLIKLGGSIITNKEVPMMVRADVLKRLVGEIAQAREKAGVNLVVGHGSGSFAHAPALRYKTSDGFINDDSLMGMAITQDSAAQLNRVVVKEFLAHHVPAVSFLFSNSLVTRNKKAAHWCSQVLEEYMEKGLFPITCGDVIVDEEMGCTIWSTEKVLAHLAESWIAQGKKVNRVIHVTEVSGVLDTEGQVIPEISWTNSDVVKTMISSTKGFDVTGGMWHKIEESLALTDKGIESLIISGLKKNNLYRCLVGEQFEGTLITAPRLAKKTSAQRVEQYASPSL